MNIKEDTQEKDNVKKVKKPKKEKLILLKTENGTSETHIEDQKKKRKRFKVNEELVDVSENNDVKKKKKRKIASDTVIDVAGPDCNVTNWEGVSKKKKKKLLIEDERETESVENSVQKETIKQTRTKEPRVKHKSLQTDSSVHNVKIEKAEKCDADDVKEQEKAPKKAKKVKKEIVVTDTDEAGVKDKKKKRRHYAEEDISVDETMTRKKTKKNKSVNIEISESDQIQNVNVKKKKAKNKSVTKEDEPITATNKKVKREVHSDSENVTKEISEEKDLSRVKKKKDKKSKSENVMNIVVESKKSKKPKDSVTMENSENPEPKKKKKTMISKESDKEPLLLECEEVEEVATSKGKQNKLSAKKMESKVETEAGTKTKKKIKEEQVDQEDVSHVEVLFLSEKAGNTDEVNINQERRHALQMEIDQASQPQKPPKASGFGQWSTAEFGSSEQKQKFLRLMGGFKKGFQPATSSSSGSGNMALGKNAQQHLEQGLLGEFERAHSRKIDFNSKGSGLGYTAQSKKKFSIDINRTQSIRFDD